MSFAGCLVDFDPLGQFLFFRDPRVCYRKMQPSVGFCHSSCLLKSTVKAKFGTRNYKFGTGNHNMGKKHNREITTLKMLLHVKQQNTVRS